MKIDKLLKHGIGYIINHSIRFDINSLLGFYRNMPDEEYLRIKFKNKLGYELNIEMPSTFNEKLQWLKLYDRNPLYTKLVDKYEVKKYLAAKIGSEYIIPTLGVWDRFEDIDFEALPNSFVLKCTHDSGSIVICRDKKLFDYSSAKHKLTKALKRNFYWVGREWPYKDVNPRIIAEKYIGGLNYDTLSDYKFMCFNGSVKCCFTCTERFSQDGLKVTFFDNDWNIMPFERHYPKSLVPIPRPKLFGKMVEISETLSAGIPFVRVDLYYKDIQDKSGGKVENDGNNQIALKRDVEGKIYFGELTFYPGCGFEEFSPEEWDLRLGSWIKLPFPSSSPTDE